MKVDLKGRWGGILNLTFYDNLPKTFTLFFFFIKNTPFPGVVDQLHILCFTFIFKAFQQNAADFSAVSGGGCRFTCRKAKTQVWELDTDQNVLDVQHKGQRFTTTLHIGDDSTLCFQSSSDRSRRGYRPAGFEVHESPL